MQSAVIPCNANVSASLVLVAHRLLLANAQGWRFILFYIDFTDLTKNCVGGILKKEEMPDSVGRLHYVLLKAVQSFESLGGFTFYSLSFL